MNLFELVTNPRTLLKPHPMKDGVIVLFFANYGKEVKEELLYGYACSLEQNPSPSIQKWIEDTHSRAWAFTY